jgi:hypothetical protein
MFEKYQVILADDEDEWEDSLIWEGLDHDYAAQLAADWFWYHCDGWEWMQKGAEFLVRAVDDTADVRKIHVSVDFEPVFYATEVPE